MPSHIHDDQLSFFFYSQCPTNFTCMPNTGPNPTSEYISYDNFGWSLLTSLQLVTMDFWESIYNSVSRVLVNFVTSDMYLNMTLCRQQSAKVVRCSLEVTLYCSLCGQVFSADVNSFHAGDCYQRTVVRILFPVCDLPGAFLLD